MSLSLSRLSTCFFLLLVVSSLSRSRDWPGHVSLVVARKPKQDHQSVKSGAADYFVKKRDHKEIDRGESEKRKKKKKVLYRYIEDPISDNDQQTTTTTLDLFVDIMCN